jgi:hypothetical protein
MNAEWPRRAIRDFLVREHGQFAFQPRHDVQLPKVDVVDLYIHIPFCESLCPYCPYNRTLYDAELAARYVQALHDEIEHYYGLLGDIEIGSMERRPHCWANLGRSSSTFADAFGMPARSPLRRFRITLIRKRSPS